MKQVSLYWLYIKKKKNNVKDPYRELGNKKKENEKDYTRASSHKDIWDLHLGFALRITKVNYRLVLLHERSMSR